MYFFGRGLSAFFNQFFKWLFWNKTGQKLLFSILIVVIFFVFIKCGEVAAVEEVTDINYEVKSYYEGVVNDAILRLNDYFTKNGTNNDIFSLITNNNFYYYFYYGASDGSSYNNAKPIVNQNLHIGFRQRVTGNPGNVTANDYMGVTGYTMYSVNLQHITFNGYTPTSNLSSYTTYYPLFVVNYVPENWQIFINALKNNDNAAIINLLEDINESLSNTTPTSETDSFVDVDTSAVEDISSAQVDNVFSSMTTNFANKFTNYDLTTTYSFVWNLNGTNITFYSDTLYKMIRGTFFETLLSMLWYYIFGHYAFVWLSNIIHKIKDGSILDGLEVNEVITKEML